MPDTSHSFGGNWTAEKLERVRKYLVAYATIMKEKQFRFAYIDAFAGTGYRTAPKDKGTSEPLFPELLEEDSQDFIAGSARIALQIKPRFNKYIFIELNPKRVAQLEKLKEEFTDLAQDISVVPAEANVFLKDLCLNRDWSSRRAVLFLDPYGMQVTWDTIEAIAKTQAIDMYANQ